MSNGGLDCPCLSLWVSPHSWDRGSVAMVTCNQAYRNLMLQFSWFDRNKFGVKIFVCMFVWLATLSLSTILEVLSVSVRTHQIWANISRPECVSQSQTNTDRPAILVLSSCISLLSVNSSKAEVQLTLGWLTLTLNLLFLLISFPNLNMKSLDWFVDHWSNMADGASIWSCFPFNSQEVKESKSDTGYNLNTKFDVFNSPKLWWQWVTSEKMGFKSSKELQNLMIL